MPDASVVAVLSSGRCGTRWLADGLHELYPEVETEHLPIGALYSPRRYFRRYDDPAAILKVAEVRRHVAHIASARVPYVETGWPVLAALPLLAELLGDRLRVVHLTRHPVASALAHLANEAYAGSARDDRFTRLATLGPTDRNVFQPRYAEVWPRLSPYEKCLFWWTEINLFGLELPGRMAAIPFIRIKAEELLSGDRGELRRLLLFLSLPWDERWPARANESLGRWQRRPGTVVDPLQVHRHPATVQAAWELGYDVAALRGDELYARGVSSYACHGCSSPG